MAYSAIMSARLRLRRRTTYEDGSFTQMVIWEVPQPIPPSEHIYKYSLVYVVDGRRVVGYDNERGKGDHRHIGDVEESLAFVSIEDLLRLFLVDVETARKGGQS
jgi:hypothetical protein